MNQYKIQKLLLLLWAMEFYEPTNFLCFMLQYFFKGKNIGSRKIAFLVICFFISVTSFATVNSFTHLTIQDGLSQSTINTIFQDKSGFLWFGTDYGLNRYDGYTFKKYLPSFRNTDSLSDPEVKAIVEDHNGNIWIGTYGGINILNQNTEEFTYIRHNSINLNVTSDDVNVLYADRDSCIWAGSTEGLNKYTYVKSQKKQDSLMQISFSEVQNSILRKNIIDIGRYDASTLWVLTSDSLGFISSSGEAKELPFELKVPTKAIGYTCILWLENEVYLGGKNGMIYFNIKKTEQGWTQKLFNGKSIENISFLKQDFKNNIWIGTKENGVFVLNRDYETIQNHRHNEILSKSLNNDFARAMLVTNSGLVVIGTNFGLNLYDEKQRLFNQLAISPEKESVFQNIHGMLEDDKGNIWFGTKGGGVFVFNTEGKLLLNLKKNAKEIFSDNILCVHQDGDGVFWLGSLSRGIYKIVFQSNNYSNPKIYHYEYAENRSNSIPSNEINAIFEDLNGDLWFGTSSGLCCLLPSESNKLPNDAKFTRYYFNPENEKAAIADNVYSIYRDRLGALWLGTLRAGLVRINNMPVADRKNSVDSKDGISVASYVRYMKGSESNSIAGNDIYSIYEDKLYGNLWMATNEGLCRFSRETNSFKNYTIENGLAGNIVFGVLEDNKGCLWLSTNRGISKYNQEQDVFYNYCEADGLQYPEFNGRAYLKTRKGLLLFGGAKGINSFYPEKIKSSPSLFPVYITGIRINNREIKPNDETKIFSCPIHKTKKIILKHNQNFISFSFVLLNFQQADLNGFAYRLKGYQDDWTYTTGDNVATYTGLPPGTYEFQVNGADGYSLWDTETKKMLVVVKPPLLFSPWAKLMYILLFCYVVYFARREYRKRMTLKRDIELQRLIYKKNQEIYEEKLEFFTNVSHEFLTPLSLIIGPTHDLILEQKEAGTSKKLKLINRSAVRLKNLIDQVLSFRKIDAGQMPISVVKDNIEFFARKVASGFNGLASRKNIRYEFEVKETSKNVWFDHDMVEKIFYNLLSNAFKNTSDGGEINVVLSVTPGEKVGRIFEDFHLETKVCESYIAIEVKDNGIGISKDNKSRIFERYFQVNKRIDGAGVGLSFAQSLAQLHKGTIAVKSKLGKGSSFTLYLPIGDCFDEKQKLENPTQIANPVLLFEPFPLQKEGVVRNTKGLANILIVEDNEEMRYYLADALQYEFNVHMAKNGKDAIQKLESTKLELVITDIVMPEMDGFELVHYIRESSNYVQIPIIILSARIDTIQKTQGLELGIGAYISKPFEIPYLISVMKRFLEQSSLFQSSPNNSCLDITISTEIESSDTKLLIQLKKSIEEHYSDPTFNVELMAEDIGLSRSQLHRKFKGVIGDTPGNFVKEIRMKEAVHLLETTSLAIFEICYAVGFSDPKYFSKEFRKKYGMIPSRYAEPFRKETSIK